MLCKVNTREGTAGVEARDHQKAPAILLETDNYGLDQGGSKWLDSGLILKMFTGFVNRLSMRNEEKERNQMFSLFFGHFLRYRR